MSDQHASPDAANGEGAARPSFHGLVASAESLRRRLAREGRLAAVLFRRLGRDAAARRPSGARYRFFGFCDLLLAESRLAVFEEPRRAHELARWAVDLAAALDPARYGEALVHDLQARAWGRVGNALRVLGDHRQAEAAFHTVRAFLDQGTGDLLGEAELLDLQASLRSSQRRYPEAFRLLARAIAIYRRLNDPHRLGRALISSGTIHGDAGDFARAIDEITEGLARIDVDAEPRLAVAARHNLALYLHESGRSDAARDLLAAEAADSTWARLRRRWLEGMMASRDGEPTAAEAALLEARQGFVEKGLGYDAALVSLNLAALYAEQRRTAEIKRLAAEMLPIFRACDVDREALAALMVFRRASELETVTAHMLHDLAAGLERAFAAHGVRSLAHA